VKGRKKPVTKIQCQAEKLAIIDEAARPDNALFPSLLAALRTVASDRQIPYCEQMCTQQSSDATYDRLEDLDLAVHIKASTTQALPIWTLGSVAIVADEYLHRLLEVL